MTSRAKNIKYAHITAQCFINAPFSQLRDGDLLELFIKHRLQPEIGLEGNCLWEMTTDDFAALADTFREHNLPCTLHAPFFDLAPGGFDSRILEATREKLTRAFKLLDVLYPKSIVCHLGFEENKHQHKVEQWLETSLETWRPLLEIAASSATPVMFENTYERSPRVHRMLFDRLDYPHLGFCLDTGHLTAFARTDWRPWLDTLSSRLGQLHLHDNYGTADDHLALGTGLFDFPQLFKELQQKQISPLLTLEPHSKEALWQSLAYIRQTSLF